MAKEKNLGKLKSRFEVRGGLIDEFNFHQNQGAMAEEERDRFARQEEETALREGEAATQPPQTEAERIAQLTAEAHEKAAKNLRKKEKQAGSNRSAGKKSAGGAKKGTGKKAAATKAAKPGKQPAKKASSKSSAGKGGSKKSAAKKRGGRGR